MAKSRETIEESGRSSGFLMAIVIVTVIGIVIWLAMSHDNSN